MSKVNVTTKKIKFPAAEDLYGLFFEDINRSGDGGLYPEMIRNRAFEDSIMPENCTPINGTYGFESPTGWRDEFNNGEGLTRWLAGIEPTDVPAWYVQDGQLSLDREDTLNDNRLASLQIHFEQGGYLYNTGYRGISLEKGKQYVFYMFAKAEKKMELELILKRPDGEEMARTTVCVEGGTKYRRYDAVFLSGGEAYDCVFQIQAGKAGVLKLGFTSLMPKETYKGHGMRKDLMEMLKETHSRFLRFPGGCIVEGFTKETMMRFPNTIGPVWERPSQVLMWHYRSTNGLGYHEYLQICEDLELEPMYVINCGLTCQGRCEQLLEGEELELLLKEACDAIDYATAPAGENPWGTLRAEAGHPEPFGMKYVEIGNENHGEEYFKRYGKFYKTLKERYPEIIFISNEHTEKEGYPTEVVDEHYYSTPEFFQENQDMFAGYDRKGPKIFIGEYAVTSGNDVGNLYSALAEAMYLTGIENNQDVVALTSYAPLLENAAYTGWSPNLIAFNNHQVYGIPLYYVIQMMAKNRGNQVLESCLEGNMMYTRNRGIPGLIAYENGVSVKNIRHNKKPVSLSHQLVGHGEKEDGELQLIVGPSMELEAFPGIGETKKEICYVTFGEEAAEHTVFEADIRIDSPDVPLAVTVWNAHCPMLFAPDETTVRSSDWSPIFTEHYSWIIQNKKGTICSAHWFQDQPVGQPENIDLPYGEYVHLCVEADAKGFACYINDKLVQTAELFSHPCTAVTASQEGDEVIVKLVNMSEETDAVKMTLDCPVESDYEVTVLTGDTPKARNSFGDPYRVAPKRYRAAGADRQFVFWAQPLSLNILRLKKK